MSRSGVGRKFVLAAVGITAVIGLAVASVAAPPTGAQTVGSGGIGDRVWNDANGNGIQDAGEGGVPGVMIRVHSTSGALLGQAVSDALGRFLVGGIVPDLVTVSVDTASLPLQSRIAPQSQTGWTLDSDFNPLTGTTRSYANAGGNLNVDLGLVGVLVTPTSTVVPTSNATTTMLQTSTTAPPTTAPPTVSTTLAQPAGISGTVWNDTNANGRRDPNESRVAGTIVGLHRVVGGAWTWYSSALTNFSGSYAFIGLPTGSYAVVIDRGAGRAFSPPNVGSDDLDSDTNDLGFVVANSTASTTSVVDAGLLFGGTASTTAPATTMVQTTTIQPSSTLAPSTVAPSTVAPSTVTSTSIVGPTTTITSGCRPIRVMPLGDSITAWPDSYRGYLYQWLRVSGRNVDFVGRQVWQPTVGGDADHEGHGGYTIGPDANVDWLGNPGNLDWVVKQALPAGNPDVVILAIGANDIAGGGSIAVEAPNRLAALVDSVKRLSPNAWIIVGDQIPTRWSPNSSPTIDAFNARARFLGEASATDRVVWGNTLAGLKAQAFDLNLDLQDESHLSASGGAKYAVAWRPTVVAAIDAVGCLR